MAISSQLNLIYLSNYPLPNKKNTLHTGNKKTIVLFLKMRVIMKLIKINKRGRSSIITNNVGRAVPVPVRSTTFYTK